MDRIPEPELMDDEEQAQAYAEADFSEPHSRFIELCQSIIGSGATGYALDLGCGPGDIAMRFARAYPTMCVQGVDGAQAMLDRGLEVLAKFPELSDRVELIHGVLPGARLPRETYDVIISNSLLHHLHDPQVLWQMVKHFGRAGAMVFIMDLMRPDSIDEAEALVEAYAADEPEILRRDFYNSLLAAFKLEEVRAQLQRAGLANLIVEQVSDRHLTIAGHLRG